MNKEARERLAKIVRQARGQMSYRAYGRLLGVSGTTVQGWETLQYVPERDNLAKIAAHAGYTLEELLRYLEGDLPDPSLGSKEVLLKAMRQLPKEELLEIVYEGTKILAGV